MAADQNAVMSALRRAKREAAFTIALADIAGIWDLDRVTRSLTEFADHAIRAALRFVVGEMGGGAGGAHPVDRRAAGLVVLAMGKYGAFELNYSSDVDLIALYDPDRFSLRERGEARGAAVRIVRGLVKLLSETTADGYVFRTDLRLRPDAGATQIAISTDAAEAYYESMGQNWERAALIKARACAGDREAAEDFLKALEPFVWRRNLDYAAIEDIHSIKRQINAHGRHNAIAVEGHNIKLGRGGIREIEFFVQTQQLIAGGRNMALRASGTLAALDALRARGLVSDQAAADLTKAYRYLRKLEHRLQMVEDQQTHTLPKDAEGLAHIACFMGYRDVEEFRAALTQVLETVQEHYAHLFEKAPELGTREGSLVFTGVEDDPETIATLRQMGFRNPSHVAGAVRGWHHGRIRATRSARARELLTRLMPQLLAALAQTADPDAAFTQFDRFVSNLPSGVQLFSLFLAREDLLRRIATITGSAPRLAVYLGRHPSTLDALLDPGFLTRLPDRSELDALLAAALGSDGDYEAALESARRFAREQSFRVGVQIIEGTAEAAKAGPAFANIAESVIAGLLPLVERALAATAGMMPDGAFAVLAMGKLGGREMTATSDLDLIFVYDSPAEESSGEKRLPRSVYYTRLAQRFISALTTPTAAGPLYEVDLRLRPSGNKGPVAVSLESFTRYNEREAWTWERLALTRARAIAGNPALLSRVEAVVADAIAQSDRTKVLFDVREMRRKLAAEYPARNRWDLKYTQGGLIDIEFSAQALQLLDGRPHGTNTIGALHSLAAAGALARADEQALARAAALQNALTHVLRIALDGQFDPHSATTGLKALLTKAGGAEDFASLERTLFALQDSAHAIFMRVLG